MTTTTVTVPVEQLENWRNDLSLHGVGDIQAAVEIDAMLSAAPAPEGRAVEAMRRDMAAIGHAIRMLTDEIGRIPEKGRDPVTINNLKYYASHIADWSGRYTARRAQPPAREDAQPVAWRYRFVTSTCSKDLSDWFVVDDSSSIPTRENQTVQPLYTAPPPPEADKLRVERIESALRNIAYMDCYTREGEEPVHLLMMRQALAALQGGA